MFGNRLKTARIKHGPRSEYELRPARPSGSVVPYEKLDPSPDQPLPFDD